MRTVVVLEVTLRPANRRLWAWCLTFENPPGFERVWFTLPGGGSNSVPQIQFSDVNVERHLFTYTARESRVDIDDRG